ncbi:hypothetical protein F2P56_032458 [Juglans regia]|uniref:Protein FAR1-RELATED SEQUENCE n=1 Tax=Juglans regia TaxID=51240 RepID=A0A833X7V7_JUGRE|nr:hypothetical protein F2P56_032458 [Juglans regia]
MKKSFAVLVQEASGFENLPFLEKDCRNYIDKARYLQLGKCGAGTLCEYFERMQYKNDGFFAMIDFDDDVRLRNVFRADARSKVAYQYFSAVVTFDTTYLTNRTNLKEFTDQYDAVLRKKIENENEADCYSFNVTILVVSVNPLGKIFQKLYTNSKFREVQREIMGMLGCLPILHQKDVVVAIYHVETKFLLMVSSSQLPIRSTYRIDGGRI